MTNKPGNEKGGISPALKCGGASQAPPTPVFLPAGLARRLRLGCVPSTIHLGTPSVSSRLRGHRWWSESVTWRPTSTVALAETAAVEAAVGRRGRGAG